jgi:aspartate 1-decarboxylase
MLRRFLLAKIRDIRITGTHLEYEGSITIDEEWLTQSGIMPDEEVQVVNMENGNRFTTYVIKGKAGSRTIELNGPAARLGLPGDRVMVLCYAFLSPEEVAGHAPRIVSGGVG